MQTKVSAPSSSVFGIDDRQEMINRHSFCLGRLRRAAEETNTLRRENDALRSVNIELGKKLRLLIQSSLQQSRLGSRTTTATTQPLGRDADRFALPKSISVKTDEYVKADNGRRRTRTSTTRSRSNNAFHSVKQKVYVNRGKSHGDGLSSAVEIEVNSQGSMKTELCAKWQETGECPYGGDCRFAHGVDELRPVIRHPRYKTEVCRMVLAGVACPYGHRCHFLHASSAAGGPLHPTAAAARLSLVNTK